MTNERAILPDIRERERMERERLEWNQAVLRPWVDYLMRQPPAEYIIVHPDGTMEFPPPPEMPASLRALLK